MKQFIKKKVSFVMVMIMAVITVISMYITIFFLLIPESPIFTKSLYVNCI